MKHLLQKLTALAAFLLAVLTVTAQTWVPPTKPTRPAFPDLEYPELPIEDLEYGKAYYIRCVASGQFLTGANNWGTQISATEDMMPYASFVIEALDNADYPDCCTIRLNGVHYFSGYKPNGDYLENRKFENTYMFRENENTGQLDRRNQVCYYWKIVKEGDYYRIQSAPGLGGFNTNGDQWIYEQGAGKPVLMNGTADTPGVDWQFVPYEGFDAEGYREQAEYYNTMFEPLKEQYDKDFEAYQTALPIYNARLYLYELLCDATMCEANTEQAGAVYNNPESTVEEINAASEELRNQVRDQMIVYGTTKSTADNPIDLTKYLLLNPDFMAGNADNWDITPGIGQNLGYQANNIYLGEDGDVEVNQFIEAWTQAPVFLADGTISQTIFGLPSAHYRLECDAMSVNQTAVTDYDNYVDVEDYKGVYLYYSDGQIVVPSDFVVTAVRTEDENGFVWHPQHFVFEFDIDKADSINVGMLIQDANVNWVLADNFRLYAAGPNQTPASFTALRAEYNTAKQLIKNLEENDYDGAQASVENTLNETMDIALALIEAGADASKVEAYTAAFTALKDARTAMQASVAAYTRLEDFIEKLYEDQKNYAAKAYCEPVAEVIGQIIMKAEDDADAGILSVDDINALINGYDAQVSEAMMQVFKELAAKGEELEEPLEITSIYPHMSYAYGETQTSFANGYPAENPVWMNPGNLAQFKTNYSTAEVWDVRPFEIYREFTDLPKGKYRIETHAFTRVGENQANYDEYVQGNLNEGGYAYIYAGNTKVDLPNVVELAVPETATGYAAVTVDEEGGQIFVPNSQQSFYNLLSDPEATDRQAKSLVGADGIVATDGGTLRVGIVGTEQLPAKHWVIWSGFRLYYYGNSDEVLIAALNEELTELVIKADEAASIAGVEEPLQLLTSAVKHGTAALDAADVDSKSAAIDELRKALAVAEEEHKLMRELQETMFAYEGRELEGVYTGEEYPALLKEINGYIESEGAGLKTLQQIRDLMAALPDAFYKHMLSNQLLDDATEVNPVEMTDLLVNADFSVATTANRTAPNGWVLELEKPDAGNVQSNNGGFEIWNTGGARLYQELPMLREGYWRLTTDGLFRTGNADEALKRYKAGTLDVYGYLFANEDSTKLYSWFAENQCTTEELGLGGMQRIVAEGDTLYAPNSGATIQNYYNAGHYLGNAVVFHYTQGPVTVGVFKNADTTIAQDWIYVDNFRLFYLGTEPPVAVSSVNAISKNPVAIYTMDGQRHARMQRGVNILRMADGSVRKVLVR